jgi:UDP-N-acetylglucosamine:LPS N-acetylglucosamine transferase
MGKRRVLAIASAGGHWVQMRRLSAAFEGCDVGYVSTYKDLADTVGGARFYKVTDVTRRNPARLLRTALQLAGILLKERPDIVITTGALPGLICIALAKMLTKAETVWIDSIANCEELSSSGKQARRFADQWLTQWPELARPDGPHYWGAVL